MILVSYLQYQHENAGRRRSMLHYLIMCRSLTYAQRAARVLERSGITAIVTKAPQGAVQEGCAYCVKVSERRLTDALRALKNADLGPGRVFLQEPSGEFREVSR
jgi:hypothetical protein